MVHAPKTAPATTKTVEVKGAKNGKTRVVALNKLPKYYPGEDVAKPRQSRKSPKPAKIRSSITPGTVLILLAGRFRGKRVVFVKQLSSGLLLVTGPHKINGVPMRRVNQAYVLATSTKVDLAKIAVGDKVDDALFKKPAEKKLKKPTEAGLFEQGKKSEKTIDPVRAAEQKALDAAIVAEVKKVPQLKSYLNASFSLSKGQLPHLLKF